MSRKLSLGAVVAVAAMSAAVTVSLTYVYAMKNFNAKVADVNERQAMYNKLSEIDQKVRQEYVGKIDETELNDGICAGYLAGLGDSHAKYMSAEKYKAYLNANKEQTIGVGVKTIRDSDGNMEVIQVLSNSAAEKSGIKKGDTIVSVDGKEVLRLTYGDALNSLDGIAGSKVKLGILRKTADGNSTKTESKVIEVTRAEYTDQTLSSFMINGNVAYINISAFTDTNACEFNDALAALVKKQAVGLVVDLRGNSGGSMKGMAAMLDTLLPAGNTVSYRGKSGKTTVEYTSTSNAVNLPVSVLVNGDTLGAAELFAADIRDYKKGLLVGKKTGGSGTKDEVVALSDGSAIVLSVANYLTLNGETFTGKGIDVDIGKELTQEQQAKLVRGQLAEADDPQLQAAVAALIRQGAGVQQVPGSDSGSASSSGSSGSAASSGTASKAG
ncbi:MAG: PDZ domain-containing protein [Clostridiales bacterium]|nr:PDZ domain-containing protein [Clostridiales bacterium]